jgi:hypothetical protein
MRPVVCGAAVPMPTSLVGVQAAVRVCGRAECAVRAVGMGCDGVRAVCERGSACQPRSWALCGMCDGVWLWVGMWEGVRGGGCMAPGVPWSTDIVSGCDGVVLWRRCEA